MFKDIQYSINNLGELCFTCLPHLEIKGIYNRF